jgi:hypothetical protein
VFDRRRRVIEVTWEQSDRREGPGWSDTAPFWSVSFLWTLWKYRRKAIATRLISVATDHLGTSVDQLGASWPLSESGEPFARALWPGGIRFGS